MDITIGFFLALTSLQTTNTEVELKINKAESELTLGTEVLFTISVKNMTDNTVRIEKPEFDEQSITLEFFIKELGNKYEYSRYKYDPFIRDKQEKLQVPLEPGESLKTFVEFTMPLTGTYEIKAKLKGKSGIVYSNPLKLQVKPAISGKKEQKYIGAVLTMQFARNNKEEEELFLISLYPENAFNSVSNFITTAKNNFYNGLKVFKLVQHGFMQMGCPYNKGFGTAGFLFKREKTEDDFTTGSLALCNAPKGEDYAGSQFFITLSNITAFKGKFTKIGEIISKKDKLKEYFLERAVNTENSPYDDIIIKSVTIVTLSSDEIAGTTKSEKDGDGNEGEEK